MHNTGGGGGGVGDIVEAAGGGGGGPQHERIVPHSGPLGNRSAMRKSASFAESVSVSAPLTPPAPHAHGDDDDDYVEITLDVRDDSVAVHSVKPARAAGGNGEDSDVTLLARTLEKRSSSYGHGVLRNASTRIKQFSKELRRLASLNRRGAGPIRMDKAAHALKEFKFISKTDRSAGWTAVEKRFDDLAEDGLLHRSKFGKCIGMKELPFAGELFDALARRRNIFGDIISKAELFEFWEQISDTTFGSRQQTIDMVDKDAEEEFKEVNSRYSYYTSSFRRLSENGNGRPVVL